MRWLFSFSVLVSIFSQDLYCGGYSCGDPPLPIPNRAVKPVNADGTDPPVGRVGSRRSSRSPRRRRVPGFFHSVVCLRLFITPPRPSRWEGVPFFDARASRDARASFIPSPTYGCSCPLPALPVGGSAVLRRPEHREMPGLLSFSCLRYAGFGTAYAGDGACASYGSFFFWPCPVSAPRRRSGLPCWIVQPGSGCRLIIPIL